MLGAFLSFIFLALPVLAECESRTISAPSPLPHVSRAMEKPDFWIKKIQDPDRLLLTPAEIEKMNEENLKREDLWLCSVKGLKEEWTRDEILALLDEDWQGFGDTGEIRYDRRGRVLAGPFWTGLKANLDRESLKETNRMFLGLIVRPTDIRVFPTETLSLGSPGDHGFDRFQHSTISPGSPVGVYGLSKDKIWTYVQTPFIRGWIRTADVAIGRERKEVTEYEEATERLVITGSFVRVYGDPGFRQTVFLAQMGSSFPLLSQPDSSQKSGQAYVVRIPVREKDGHLAFRNGFLRKGSDVHLNFLSFTQKNVARQAFKMLHTPYGWGDMSGGRDCSRFIMDIFGSFGILMPRNSKFQAQIGIVPETIAGKSLQEKKGILDQAVPLATTLRLPGHIMLYLGADHGRHYVIHSAWEVQRAGKTGLTSERIGKVAVSDLSLGSSGPRGSLLERITDIRYIGSNTK
jgi:cell wall-associated NlpC family hydrolase